VKLKLGRPIFQPWFALLQSAKDFDETSEAIAVNSSYAQSVLVHWGVGTKDGEIVVECADSKNFNGTWAELKRMPWIGSNTQEIFEHNGPCAFIRTRVSKAIIGGTVATKLQAMAG
jgi:hypothetical protein